MTKLMTKQEKIDFLVKKLLAITDFPGGQIFSPEDMGHLSEDDLDTMIRAACTEEEISKMAS